MMNNHGAEPMRGSIEPSEDSIDTLERLRADNRELRKAIQECCQSLRQENELLSDCLNGRGHTTYG